MIAIHHRIFRISTHAACTHLVRSKHHNAVGAYTVPFHQPIILAKLLLAHLAACRTIKARAFILQRDNRIGSGCKVRPCSVTQPMLEMAPVIYLDHIINHRFAEPIQLDAALAFVSGQDDKRSNIGRLQHLVAVLTRREPGSGHADNARMGRGNL